MDLEYADSVFGVTCAHRRAKALEERAHRTATALVNTARQLYALHALRALHPTHRRAIDADFVLCASVRPVASLSVFMPQVSQYVAMFVQHALRHLPQLAHEVARRAAASPRLPQLSVPALFQFFVTAEGLSDAFVFYGSLARCCCVADFARLALPFFLAPCVRGFSESLFRNVFWRSFFKISGVCRADAPAKVFEIVVETLPCLPAAHLNLLKLLSCTYSAADFAHFVVEVLIVAQLRDKAALSPLFRESSPICDIDELFGCLRGAVFPSSLMPSVSVAESVCACQKAFTRTHDIYIFRYEDIMELLSLEHGFSPVITNEIRKARCTNTSRPFTLNVYKQEDGAGNEKELNLFFENFPVVQEKKNFEYHFLLKCIRKKSKCNYLELVRKREPISPEVDTLLKSIDMDDFVEYVDKYRLNKLISKAKGFENYLRLKYREKCLIEQKKDLDYYLDEISFQVALRDVNCHDKQQIWANLMNLPNFGKIQFWYLILMFNQKEQSFIAELNLKRIESKFSLLIDNMKTIKLILPQTVKVGLWEANTVLSMVDSHSSFLDRFIALLFYMEEIERISYVTNDKNNKLKVQIINNSISACCSVWILKTLLYFHLIALKDDRFRHLCSNSFLELWSSFTALFTNVLADDEDLLSKFSSLMNSKIYFE